MSYDHADVGGLLLSEWRLPKSLEDAVRFHHRLGRSRQFPLESSITHVADLITNALEMGTSGEHFVPALEVSAWVEIGLSASVIGPLTQQMDQQFHDTANLFLEDIVR